MTGTQIVMIMMINADFYLIVHRPNGNVDFMPAAVAEAEEVLR